MRSTADIEEVRRLYAGGLSLRQIAKALRVSKTWAGRQIDRADKQQRIVRCSSCGRELVKPKHSLCWRCRYRRPGDYKGVTHAQTIISPWQTLPDGTLSRTVTGTG